MILVDLSNILHAVMHYILPKGQADFDDKSAFKGSVIRSLLSVRNKYRDYGRMVLCVDTGKSWRKENYSFYKGRRAKKKKESCIDWSGMDQLFNEFIDDMRTNLPWYVIGVQGAEADDVIGVLAREFGESKTKIIGSDKDFIQLHTPLVSQYSTVKDKEVTAAGFLSDYGSDVWIGQYDPIKVAREYLILHGDSVDDIPSVITSTEDYVGGVRQKPVTKAIREKWINGDDEFYKKYAENIARNRELIDLRCTPENIHRDIMLAFHQYETGTKATTYRYLTQNKLTTILDRLQEF